jgi:hypothetical protein
MAFEIEKFKHKGRQVFGSDFSGVVKNIDSDQRTITLIASDESRDRDGDIISVKAGSRFFTSGIRANKRQR